MQSSVHHYLRATFRDRPNRFLVRCEVEGEGLLNAQLPNPGRLWELLFPGATLYLTADAVNPAHDPGPGVARKTRHTVWAVERDGQPVFLHTHKSNDVARALLEHSRIIKSEAVHGHSRFDFLLEEHGRPFFLEVKSVTLFGNGAAMFPDAVTERGRRHLLELADLADAAGPRAPKPVVLFLVHTSRVDRFLPDYHTDLAFSRALLEVRDRIRLLPVAISWTRGIRLGRVCRRLPIPWDFIDREAQDRGAYLLPLHLPETVALEIGSLGQWRFQAGWYVYVGSAMTNLSQRIARHQRLRKRMHWHVDYLRAAADRCIPLPIRSSRREECALAFALSAILSPGPRGFGSSDCACPTHLFFSPLNPLHRPEFHAVLQRFRMPALEDTGAAEKSVTTRP